MQNIGWDLARRSLPILGSAIVFVFGNALVQLLAGRNYAASAWLWPLIVLLPALLFAYRVSIFPGRVRWTLPEAVAFLAFDVPIKKTDWILFNMVRYHRGEVRIDREVTSEGEHEVRRSKTIVKESQRKEFVEKTQNALELLLSHARRGELTITGRPLDREEIVEIPPNFFIEQASVDFVRNELSFTPHHSNTYKLPRFQQVLFFKDEVLAIRGFWKPLWPPRELSREELNKMWSEKWEHIESVKVTPGTGEIKVEGFAPTVSVTKPQEESDNGAQ